MQDAINLFKRFCAEHDIAENDERLFVWLSAFAETRNQTPVAYASFCADGSLNALIDYLPPDARPSVQPLYASPVANVPKAPISRAQIMSIWQTYYAPDDIEGLVRFVERYHRN